MIYIAPITVIIATGIFNLTLLHSFIGCYFEYLSLSHLQVCVVSLSRLYEFKDFFPCSFLSPSLKGANTFWKLWGIIGGFNESRRQISSEVGKIADESMGAIRFCTTQKGDLFLGSRSHGG